MILGELQDELDPSGYDGVRFDYFPAQELVFDGWMFWAMKLNKWVKRMLRR